MATWPLRLKADRLKVAKRLLRAERDWLVQDIAKIRIILTAQLAGLHVGICCGRWRSEGQWVAVVIGDRNHISTG